MYTVTWIECDELHTISTPKEYTARQLASRLPMARLWFTVQAGRPALVAL